MEPRRLRPLPGAIGSALTTASVRRHASALDEVLAKHTYGGAGGGLGEEPRAWSLRPDSRTATQGPGLGLRGDFVARSRHVEGRWSNPEMPG
jgi:hypothetical protein